MVADLEGLVVGSLATNREILDTLKTEGMITVELIDNADSDLVPNKAFEWSIGDYTEAGMEIQLEFEQPLEISKSTTDDEVKVSFVDTSLLFDVDG